MSVVHVLLIRHGQTDANAQGILQGQSPTSLNRLGDEQAERLAGRLATFEPRVTQIVSSDLPRAAETAAAIARRLGLPIAMDPAWRERGFGVLEGQAIGELEIWRAAAGAVDPPGAESLAALDARVEAALTALASHARPGACLAVVSHGGVIRAVLRLLAEGQLPRDPAAPAPDVAPIANASILHLVTAVPRVRWTVVRMNDVDHLDVVTLSDGG